MKSMVKTPEQALVYLAECELATVASMVVRKRMSKSELNRQISIAQSAVDWIKDFKIVIKVNSRIYEVLSLPDQSVETWCKQLLR